MKIEIYDLWRNNRTVYFWTLYDGPDGIDKVTGYATTLEETVCKILEWRERIGSDYFDSATEGGLLSGESESETVGDRPTGGSEHGDSGLRDDGDPEGGPSH